MIETKGFFEVRNNSRGERSISSRNTPPPQVTFERMLQQGVETELGDEYEGANYSSLEELLDTIERASDNLKRNASWSHVIEYKKLVTGFLKIAAKQTMEIENAESALPGAIRKRYALIKLVDKNLNELVHAFIKNENNSLEILEKVGQIQGLLIDLRS